MTNIIDYLKVNELLKREIYNLHCKIYVLRNDETIDYEIPQEDIILDSINFSENYNQGERKNISFSLINTNNVYTPNIRGIWVNTKFRFDVGIEDRYTKQIYWFQNGIYVLSNPNLVHNNSDEQITYNLRDKWAVLEGNKSTITTIMEIPIGSNVGEAIQGVLNIDDGTGNIIDPIPISVDSSLKDLVTPYTITKDVGSKLADLILELAYAINAEVYYDEYGQLKIIPMVESMQDTKKQVLWYYNENEILNNYSSLQILFSVEDFVNEVHVIGNNINGDNVYGVATNDNTESQYSVQRIGLRIAEPIEDTSISTEEQANDRATYELRKITIKQTQISIQVLFNPLLKVNSLIDIDGKENGNQKLVIQSISFSMPNGIMNVGCSNLENVTNIAEGYMRSFGALIQERNQYFILLEDFSLIRLEDE